MLVIVDAYTKWLEVRNVCLATSSAVIQELGWLFATSGIPGEIISDNGSLFVSSEILEFYWRNGISSVTSALYHPATNGQAERMVAETKAALRKDSQGSMELRLACFLYEQHSTVNATTVETPANRMFGRELPLALTALRLKTSSADRDDLNPKQVRRLRPQQRVFIRSFTGPPAWIPGKLVKKDRSAFLER